MRIVFFLFLISVGIPCFSQNNLARQIHMIINDTGNHFLKFKGAFKERFLDSTFNSTMTIEGTKENEIGFFLGSSSYHARIIDSVTLETAIKLVEEWKEKFENILGASFTGQAKDPDWGLENGGWQFAHEKLTVFISHTSYFLYPSLYRVRLHFRLVW